MMRRAPTVDDVRHAWETSAHKWQEQWEYLRVPLNLGMSAVEIIPESIDVGQTMFPYVEFRREYGQIDGANAVWVVGSIPWTEISGVKVSRPFVRGKS